MENAIKFLRIQNFKSIKDVTLHPRRVNLIVGEPNVGKSNLLEAMTLLGGIVYEQTEKFMGSFIRYEEPRQLFYDNLVDNTIKVETDKAVAILVFDNQTKGFEYLYCDEVFYSGLVKAKTNGGTVDNGTITDYLAVVQLPVFLAELDKVARSIALDNITFLEINNDAIYKHNSSIEAKWAFTPQNNNPTKPYSFHKNTPLIADTYDRDLAPPNGNNLIKIIQIYPKLRKEIAQMFERYGQKLQLRMDERRLEIIKDQDGIIYS
ncbi:MAG: hypothetical protein JWR44_2677, partial [Hymenobacter sp.]|nr:hypothetical protein [Hymenobacter sp.]